MELFIWILLGFLLCQPIFPGCEIGWTEFQQLCYTIIPYPYPPGGAIIDARSECRRRGADLITIKTAEYQRFIEDFFIDENGSTSVHRDVYIAAGDAMTEGYFEWFDGTPVTHNKWKTAAGEPDNHGPNGIPENCVRIKSGYKKSTGEVLENRRGLWLTVPCLAPAGRIDSVLCQRPRLRAANHRYRFFTKLRHSYFWGHEISTHSGLTNLRCLSYCLSDYRCLSVNWNEQHQTDNCILNNATRWEDNEVLLTNYTDTMDTIPWNYYESIYPAYDI